MQTEPIVYVVDDDEAMRQSLEWLLGSAGLPVVSYESGEAFLAGLEDSRSGCLIVDLCMRGMNGIDLQRELAARRIALPVIVITGFAEVPLAVSALKAGAIDFVEKPFNDQDLLDSVYEAIEAGRQTRAAAARSAAALRLVRRLTLRESQVLDGVVAGKSNRAIAAGLGISKKTVELHRGKMMEKLEAKSLADVIALACLLDSGIP